MDAHSASHPADPTLQAYGLGRLDEASAGPVHAHLKNCPACRRRVAELSSDSFLGRLRDAQGRPALTEPDAPAANGRSGRADERRYGGHIVGDRAASLAGRAPRLRDPARAGPRRDRQRLPRAEQADGAARGPQGRRRTARGASRGARPVPRARSAARPGSTIPISSPPTRPSGSARPWCSPWNMSRGSTWPGWSRRRARCPSRTPATTSTRRPWACSTPHEHGLVHGDIKPGNLMLARQGTGRSSRSSTSAWRRSGASTCRPGR